jgi:hypothetical protein
MNPFKVVLLHPEGRPLICARYVIEAPAACDHPTSPQAASMRRAEHLLFRFAEADPHHIWRERVDFVNDELFVIRREVAVSTAYDGKSRVLARKTLRAGRVDPFGAAEQVKRQPMLRGLLAQS